MSIDCYVSPGKRKAAKMARAFALGLNTTPLQPGAKYQGRDAFWYGMTEYTFGIRQGVLNADRTWVYADNAYYFGRGRYFRVTKNAWQTDGLGNASPERFEQFGLEPQPWRREGYILIATQSDLFYRMFENMSRDTWIQRVSRQIQKFTDRPIRIAHKPEPTDKARFPHGPFEELLPGAFAVVVHSSSCGVGAVLNGVPAFSTVPCCTDPVARVGRLDLIEQPHYPAEAERLQWLYNLAASQWTREEMASGQCWRELMEAEHA